MLLRYTVYRRHSARAGELSDQGCRDDNPGCLESRKAIGRAPAGWGGLIKEIRTAFADFLPLHGRNVPRDWKRQQCDSNVDGHLIRPRLMRPRCVAAEGAAAAGDAAPAARL